MKDILLQELQNLVNSVPKEVKFDDASYNPAIRDALTTWKKYGAIDIAKLQRDGKIELNDTPVSTEWFKHEYQNAIITGQIKEGRPNGFVRVLYESGSICEGFMDSYMNHKNGFSRFIYYDGNQYVGWWKKDYRHGNGKRIKKDGSLINEGWYENATLKGSYKENLNEYISDIKEYMLISK